jgi:hypothetical protein
MKDVHCTIEREGVTAFLCRAQRELCFTPSLTNSIVCVHTFFLLYVYILTSRFAVWLKILIPLRSTEYYWTHNSSLKYPVHTYTNYYWIWGVSSVGRALLLHGKCHGFESHILQLLPFVNTEYFFKRTCVRGHNKSVYVDLKFWTSSIVWMYDDCGLILINWSFSPIYTSIHKILLFFTLL